MKAVGQGVGAVKLRGESISRPDRDAKAAITEGHRFYSLSVGAAEENVGAVEHARNIEVESTVLPGSGGGGQVTCAEGNEESGCEAKGSS